MKLLLDEALPRQPGSFFPTSYEVRTVPQMGWAGAKNGILLQLAADCHFDAFITADQSIEYQQNVDTLPIAVKVTSF